MEVENRLQVYSLQRSARVCTMSLLQRPSTSTSRTPSFPALEKRTFAMNSLLEISTTRTESVCFAAKSPNKTAAPLLSGAVTGPFSSAAIPLSDAVNAARAPWRYATAPVGGAGNDINQKHRQLRRNVQQRVPPHTFLTSDLPIDGNEYSHCERVVAEMDSQGCQHSNPSAGGESSAVTCVNPRPVRFISENEPVWAGTSVCQTSTPGGPATASKTGEDVEITGRRYFSLCFGTTSSPFSYPQTSTVIPSQSFGGEYSPAHTSSHPDWKCASVFDAAAEQSCVHARITAPAPAQSSAAVDQCFFLTPPGKQGVSMSNYAPIAAAIAATSASGRHGLVAHTPVTAIDVPIPEGKVQTTAPVIPACNNGSGCTHADFWGHSVRRPLTKCRVHCRLVSVKGSRQRFLVETEQVETSSQGSCLPITSSAACSGYMDERLAKGLEENTVRFRKRRGKKRSLKQSPNHFLLHRLKKQEALSTTSKLDSPISDLDCDDTRSLSENDEQPGITAYNQKCMRDNEELRRLHECLNVRAPLPACTACAEGKESTKGAAEFDATRATRSFVEGNCTSPRVDLHESPTQIPSVLARAPAVPATASQSPNFTSMTPAPSLLPNHDAVFHKYSVASGVPPVLPNDCRAPSEAVSPALLKRCAAQTVGQTCVCTHSGAALPVTVRKDSLHQSTDILNNLDANATKGRGLHARRPPPLDPKLLDQGLDLMVAVFVPSPYSISPAREVASPNTGTHRDMRINRFDLPLNASAQDDATEEQQLQQGLSRRNLFLRVLPITTPRSSSASPAIPVANQRYDGPQAGSNVFRRRGGSRSGFCSSGCVFEQVVSDNEFSGCSRAYCPTCDIGKVQKRENETQHENQRVQETSVCLQGLYDISQLPAPRLDHEHTRRTRMTPTAKSTNMTGRAASKSVEKQPVHGLAADNFEDIPTDTFWEKYSSMSPPRKRLRISGISVLDTEQETRTPEDFSKSQRSFLSVAQKTETVPPGDFSKSERSFFSVRQETEALPATSFVTETYVVCSDLRVEDWIDKGDARQHESLSEEPELPTLRLSPSPNCNTRNVYNWTECGTQPHPEMCCRVMNSIQEQKQEDSHAKNQERCTSAAAQADQVFSTTSTVQFSEHASECCTRSGAKLNEHGDEQTGMMIVRECSPAVRGLFSTSGIKGCKTLYCGIRECAIQSPEEPGARGLQGKDHYSYRSSSASVRSTIAEFAAAHRRYTEVPSEFFTDAKTKDVASNSQEPPTPSDVGLHRIYGTAISAQNPKMPSTTYPSIVHRLEPPISVEKQKQQGRSDKQDEIPISRILPAGVSVTTRLTSETDHGVSFGCCVDTEAKDAALDGVRPTRILTPLNVVLEKEKCFTVSNECRSTSLLKQYCSRSVHSIKKKRAHEQQGRRLELVSSSMLPAGQCTPRTSVVDPSGRHYSVAPRVYPRESRLKQRGESAQLNPLQEATAVEGVSRVAHASPDCVAAARFRTSLDSPLERPGESVQMDALQDTADVWTASRASEPASAFDRHYVVASGWRSPTITPRRLGQSIHVNPLQKTAAVGSAPRPTPASSRSCAVAPPGCPLTSRRKGSGSIQTNPLQEAAAIETVPGLILKLRSSPAMRVAVITAYSHLERTSPSTQNTLQYTLDVHHVPEASGTGAPQRHKIAADRRCSVILQQRPFAHETSVPEDAFRVVADLHRCYGMDSPGCPVSTKAQISRKCNQIRPPQEASAVETSRPMAYEILPCLAKALPPSPIGSRLVDTEQCSQVNVDTPNARNASGSSKAAIALHRSAVPASRRCSIGREPNRLARSTDLELPLLTTALETIPPATPHFAPCVAVNRAGDYTVSQVNGVEICTQVSLFKKAARVERVRQETLEVSMCSGVVPRGAPIAYQLANTTEHVHISTSPYTAEVQSASSSSRASSPPHQQYKTATRGRSITTKSRWLGQAQGSSLPEPPSVATTGGLTLESITWFATALPESSANARLRDAGKLSQTDLLQCTSDVPSTSATSEAATALCRNDVVSSRGTSRRALPSGLAQFARENLSKETDVVKGASRAPVTLDRRFPVARPGAPITSQTGCPAYITRVKSTRAPVALERRFTMATPGAPITSQTGCPVMITRVNRQGEETIAKKF